MPYAVGIKKMFSIEEGFHANSGFMIAVHRLAQINSHHLYHDYTDSVFIFNRHLKKAKQKLGFLNDPLCSSVALFPELSSVG